MLRSLSLAVGLLAMMLAAGCSSLAGFGVGAQGSAAPTTERIFVATTRSARSLNAERAERSSELTYAAVDVSISATHRPGIIPAKSILLGEARDFSIAGQAMLEGEDAFTAAVAAAGRAAGKGAPRAFVFVHGFNTTFGESAQQLAQIGHDIGAPGAKVLYAWPANNRLFDYLHDLDSVAFGRDGLERLLNDFAASGVRVTLVGYSMGATLVVETLRQMKLVHAEHVLANLNGVVLLSPDMDVELFRMQVARMGELPQPFVIYGTPKDIALGAVSRYLTAEKPRLGSLPDAGALADLRLIYVDVGRVPHYHHQGHLPVATSPDMIATLKMLPEPDMIEFARIAASGGVAGAIVTKHGRMTHVTLPQPGR